MKRGVLLCSVCVIVGLAHFATGQAGETEQHYAQWENGPSADASYFPIAVWLQQPSNAERYKAAGINVYVGLWKGPTEEQLAGLRKAGMRVICHQNEVGLAHKDDPIIMGWMHDDEPDNAQPVKDPRTGEKSWGPPVKPQKVIDDYQRMRATDPTRPVLLNLGQGVANDEWVGRGNEGKPEDYPQYVKGADIVSFDVYPVAGLDKPDGENYLWYVAKGVSRLVEWTEGRKVVWNCIETTRIGSERRASPAQVRAEVWMALIHGSRGLIYFVHEWKPRFNEHALLDDPEMLEAVTAINRQVTELAPVLNSPALPQAERATVRATPAEVPIALDTRRHDGATYIFAVGMRNSPTRGTFAVSSAAEGATIEVIGEEREIPLRDGTFEDSFTPYAVHLYRIRGGESR